MIAFCVILTLVCSLRACHMWLTRNHMFIREIWGKFTSFIFWNFEISLIPLGRFQNFKKVNSVKLSQTSLLNIWLLELIECLYVNPWKYNTNIRIIVPWSIERLLLAFDFIVNRYWQTSSHQVLSRTYFRQLSYLIVVLNLLWF